MSRDLPRSCDADSSATVVAIHNADVKSFDRLAPELPAFGVETSELVHAGADRTGHRPAAAHRDVGGSCYLLRSMFTTKWQRASVLCGQVLLLVAFSIIDGCSSEDQNAGATAQPCQSSEDCPLWSCACKDGTTASMSACVAGQCYDGNTACESACRSRGGVQSFREKQTVKDSAECDAYCAKAASLGCSAEPRCDRTFYCDVDEDECAEAKRAHLQCVANEGQWACSASGGWTVTSGCPSARCERDAGGD